MIFKQMQYKKNCQTSSSICLQMRKAVSDEKDSKLKCETLKVRNEIILLNEQLTKEANWRAGSNFSIIEHQNMVRRSEEKMDKLFTVAMKAGADARKQSMKESHP